jgi:putative ABC transport system permease protein
LDVYQRQNSSPPERFDLVAGWRSESGYFGSGSFFDNRTLKDLLALTPDVLEVAQYSMAGSMTVEKDNRLYQFWNGAYVEPNYFELNNIELTSGSFFVEKDSGLLQPFLVISDKAAEVLYGDTDPIGQTLKVMTPIVASPDGLVIYTGGDFFPYTIIGIFTDKADVQQQGNALYLPMWKADRPAEGGADTLSVLAKPGRGEIAREQVLAAARNTYRDKYEQYNVIEGRDFYIREMNERIMNANNRTMLDPTLILFALFGIVSLVVGSIGIFSITLVDALEREHDTGIKRALGATRGVITREMMLESALIAGLGGLLGVLLAAVIIPWLGSQLGGSLLWNVNLRWQPLAAVSVFALTIFLGTVLGFFPALRAARVSPVEALKGM